MSKICVYCGRPAEVLDHVLPWSRRRLIDHRPELRELRFLVNACRFCNGSLGSRVFPTFEARINYIHRRHPKRIQWESQKEAILQNYRSYFHYGDGRRDRSQSRKLYHFKRRWQLRWGTILKLGPTYYIKCHCGVIFDAIDFDEFRNRFNQT